MSNKTHHYLIPGLFHLSETDLAFLDDYQFPMLSQFMQYAEWEKNQHSNVDEVVCHFLQLNEKTIPCAHVFKLAENVLIASPILLKADINSTWIQPAHESSNVVTIIEDLVEFFNEDIALIDQCSGQFVIEFKKVRVLTHLPHYLTVLGKKIDAYQSTIRENIDWFKLLNEMQMYLHGHPLNKTESGQQMLNSLWFWGGDSTKAISTEHSVKTDDELLNRVFKPQKKAKQHLVIKLDVLKYLKQNKPVSLRAFFKTFEAELSQLNLNKVCIDAAEGQQLMLSPWAKLKFWNKKTDLKTLLSVQHF